MKIYQNPSADTWQQLTERPQLELEFLDSAVRNILNRVRKSGDEAIRDLTLQLDKVSIDKLQVTPAEIESASQMLSADLRRAIETAAMNIKKIS